MTQSVDKVNKNGAKSDQHQAGGAGDDDFPAPGGADPEEKRRCCSDPTSSSSGQLRDLYRYCDVNNVYTYTCMCPKCAPLQSRCPESSEQKRPEKSTEDA